MSESLVVKIGANIDALEKAMGKATESIRNAGKQMTSLGKSMTASLTLPITLVGGALVKAASDAEETSSKFKTIFRDIADDATNSAKVLSDSFGLSTVASQKLLGDTGDLLTGFGFTQSAALDLSTEVNKLAVDLASFTNFSGGAEGASQALTKALLGERESVKSLGISILETDVQAQVLLNTQQGLTFESERQAKAYATLQIAQNQSKNAIGDFARTSGSFANQMRILRAEVSNLMILFGNELLPFATQLISRAKEMVKGFQNISQETVRLGLAIGAMVAFAGPLLIGLGVTISLLTSPITLVVAAIAGLGVAILYLRDNWEAVVERISDINWWRNAIIDMVQFAIEYSPISIIIKSINALVSFWRKTDWFKSGMQKLKNLAIEYNPFSLIIKAYNALKSRIGGGLIDIADDIEVIAENTDLIKNPFETLANSLEGLKGQTKDYKHELGSVKDAFINVYNEILGLDLLGKVLPVKVDAETGETVEEIEEIEEASEQVKESFLSMAQVGTFLRDVADNFTSSFGAGMANVIVQGEKLEDVLKNIGKLLLSSAIQKGIGALLTGGLGGTGFFGSGGGLFGKIFGKATSVNDALITSSGSVVKFNSADDILASKNMDKVIGGGGGGRVEVFGKLVGQDIFISSNRGSKTYGR